MTHTEKFDALAGFCNRQDSCTKCPLQNKVDCNMCMGVFSIADGEMDKAIEIINNHPDALIDQIDKIKQKVYDSCGVSPKILDSGNRREFGTGAVRDIQEGKGRCDLMPLDVVYELMTSPVQRNIMSLLESFKESGDSDYLLNVLHSFTTGYFYSGNGEPMTLLWQTTTMLLEVAKHFEEGAKKYGEDNWQKGIPTHCYIDSAVRHYLKYLRGDQDEPHDRAFCWNIMCCIWTCIHKPELNDYAPSQKEAADAE